ncbi:MAG: glutathione S-transferase family protein [Pseudomonadota bacterium]
MAEFTLYIGNKAYSSWSLRGWLACKLVGIAFEEVMIPLSRPETAAALAKLSPSGRVPVLRHGEIVLWETTAIAEYLAELRPQAGLWPAEAAARAHARAISAEMHAGFAELRKNMWMNVRRKFPGKGRTSGALADIARVVEIWRTARRAYGRAGPYLFGRFTLADCMYAPVATRFVTWEPELPADASAYVEAIWTHPLIEEWRAGATAEPWAIEKYETAAN